MADDIAVKPSADGTAVPVATDEVGGKHYQKMKLALGAENAVDLVLDSGQQLAAASLPTVLASDHSDIKVTLDGEATAAQLSTSAVMNGTTAVAPSYASVDTATSGDNTIVDPGPGKKVRVLAFSLIAVGTAVNVYFKTGSTAKFGSATRPLVLDKTGATGPAGYNSGFNPLGWFEGAADENLVLNLSAAQGVIGNVVYVEL